jgi:hypothetical protein
MAKLNLKNVGNSDLLKLRKDKIEEFEKVRMDIVKIYDYWRKVEGEYNLIHSECNKRNIL